MATKKSTQTKARSGKPRKAPKAEARSADKAPLTKAEAKPKKLSAIDAAAKLLAETGQPMKCKELIEAMAIAGYWTSPKGKTPHATLYAAILREIKAKGKDARFKKSGRGKFVLAQREG